MRVPASSAKKVPKANKANPKYLLLIIHIQGERATQKHGIEKIFEHAHVAKENYLKSVLKKTNFFCLQVPMAISIMTVFKRNCPLKSMGELVSNKTYDLHRESDVIVINKSGQNGYFTQILT